MKNSIIGIFLALAIMANWQCTSSTATSTGTTINGTINNSAGLRVFLDQLYLTSTMQVLANTDIDADGNFSINLEKGIEEGLYRFRIGQQRLNLVFNGTEKEVNITGDLSNVSRYNVAITGSETALETVNTMQQMAKQRMQPAAVQQIVAKCKHPLVGMSLASTMLGGKKFEGTHNSILASLSKKMPNSTYVKDYSQYIARLKQPSQGQASGPVQVGQPAPDIDLQSPDGKTHKLSDLKGQVVLLDFWASWCGPCRRENPNVVKIYDKYKAKGFTVYSVSLDGVDSRALSRAGGNQTKIDNMKSSSKKRWEKAIADDNLKWPYHVSDLKKWECEPARRYGVRGIPRTFLIDKEGKIAKVGLRGAEAIEREVAKLL